MKPTAWCAAILVAGGCWTAMMVVVGYPSVSTGQVSGNIGYAQTGGNAGAEQTERSLRTLAKDELPPSATTTFVEARILMNVKADEYVAVFGILQEGETLAESNRKMDATVAAFVGDLKELGIARDDIYVDFISQSRTYGFQVQGDFLQERSSASSSRKTCPSITRMNRCSQKSRWPPPSCRCST